MNTQDLLDELRKNILRDRSNIVSGTSDRLWDDPTLIRYINDAYYRFVRKTLCIFDTTTKAATQVTLKTGVDVYATSEAVLGVVSARLEGAAVDLGYAGHGMLDSPFRTDDSLYFDVNTITALPPGKPLAFAMDEGDHTFRVYPTPSADYNGSKINMRVVRLPLSQLSLDRLDAEPEIREEWQLGMLDWAAYKALTNHDVDGENAARAEKRKADFEAFVKEAKSEVRWRRRPATAWSFGQVGFSWVK